MTKDKNQPPSTTDQNQPPSTTDQQAILVEHTQSFSGPIPPPGALQQYEDTLPGAADRILTLAEKEQAMQGDNLEREDKNVSALIANDKIHKYIAGFIAVLMIVLTGFMAWQDYPWYSIVIVLGGSIAASIKNLFHK